MIVTNKLKRFRRNYVIRPRKHKRLHYLSQYRLKDSTIDEFCDWVLHWCHAKFGGHPYKEVPCVEWEWKDRWYQKKNLLALYDREDNIIQLRIQGHRTFNNLAKTLIHEYIHYLQWSPKRYEEWDAQYGYSNNPYEIEAEHLAQVYWGDCITQVMRWME